MAEEGICTNFSSSGGRKCSYYGCLNTTKNCNLAFFSIPFKSRGDYDRFHPGVPQRVEWLLRCNAPNEFYNFPSNKLRSKRICSKHFQREDFVNSKRRKLNPLAVPIHYRRADAEENILIDISNGRISEEINKEGSHEENKKKNFTQEAIKEKHIKGSCHSSNSSLAEDSLGTDFWNVQFNKSVQVQYPSKHLARANTTSQSMEKKMRVD